MKRISTDADYLESGKLVLDADGIPFEPASKGYVDQRVPIDSFTGTGFPEGKVTAPVGAIYTDRLATAGAVRWIKTQGTGNTGWKIEYGDTGWRKIPTTILSEGEIQFRRINETVYFRAGSGTYMVFDFASRPPGGQPGLIPDIFRPARAEMSAIIRDRGKVSAGAFEIQPNGGFHALLDSSESNYDREYQNSTLSYPSPRPWSTTLPGIPA